ncbi:uncharacterized protein LOC144115879 isoform X3 [Amblyomma americanum]
MAHSGGGSEDSTAGETEPSSPVVITQQPRVTFDLATVTVQSSPEQEDSRMDEELQALGLWEEDMTDEQKVELLRVVAASKETAQREEAVRKSQFVPAQPAVLALPIEGQEHIYWDRRSALMGTHLASSPECSDDEWLKPSSTKQCRPFKRQPLLVKVPTRRVYCMDYHLNFEFKPDDEPALVDMRLLRLNSGTKHLPSPNPVSNPDSVAHVGAGDVPSPTKHDNAADQPLPSDLKVGAGDVPSPTKHDNAADHPLASGLKVGAGDVPSPTKHDNAADRPLASCPKRDCMSPPELLKSWSAMHLAIKKAQSAPGLPVRPWGRVREVSPLLGSLNNRAPERDAELHSASAMEVCSSSASAMDASEAD